MFDNLLESVIRPKYVKNSSIKDFDGVLVGRNHIRMRIVAYLPDFHNNQNTEILWPENASCMLSSHSLDDKALLRLKQYITENKDRDKVIFLKESGNYEDIIENSIKKYHESLEKTKEKLKVRERLAEIQVLKPGWFSGEGSSFSVRNLNKVIRLIAILIDRDIPSPLIFPTVSGDIRLEWVDARKEISYEIDFNRNSGVLSGLKFSNQVFQSENISLEDIDNLTKKIQEYLERRVDVDDNMS